jgi:hypothetical protein
VQKKSRHTNLRSLAAVCSEDRGEIVIMANPQGCFFV